ncbi:MAG: M48 family metallopeptidase [Bacteroidota bacterium]
MHNLSFSWVLFLCLLGPVLSAQPNFEKNYTPLKFEGEIPEHFSRYLRGDYQQYLELAAKSEQLSQDAKKTFNTEAQYALTEAFRTGQVYINPEISDYLNELLDLVLKDQPNLRKELHIYGTAINVPNATAWPDGTIFINLSLLPYLENEAQLAFILCHEASHYWRSHSLNMREEMEKLSTQTLDDRIDLETKFELMRFSRSNELDADATGFELFVNAGYDPREGLKALEQLKKINLKADSTVLNLDALYRLPDLDMETTYGCKVRENLGLVEKANQDLLKVGSEALQANEDARRAQEAAQKQKEVEIRRKLSTHPSVDVRMAALSKRMKEEGVNIGVKFQLEPAPFFQLRTYAHFEHVQQLYDRAAYVPALYLSLRLGQSFPENQYLQEIAGKCLYWLAFYQKRNAVGRFLPVRKARPKTAYEEFVCSLYVIRSRTYLDFAEYFFIDRTKQFPDSEDLHAYMGRLFALRGAKMYARKQFESYLQKYPQGKHAAFVSQALNP